VARRELLKKEKESTRLRNQLSAERRKLPWVKVEKNYFFDAPDGKVTLADLLDGRSQLVIYHFMFGPDWQEGCPSCSFVSDHIDGALPHLAARDLTIVMVSRVPLAKIEAFKKRMRCKEPAARSSQHLPVIRLSANRRTIPKAVSFAETSPVPLLAPHA
jgi:predicted dithiol-disulfide oxidoreductase (DUF899 family)